METRHGYFTIYKSAESPWAGSAVVTFDKPMPDSNYAVVLEAKGSPHYHYWEPDVVEKRPDGFTSAIWVTQWEMQNPPLLEEGYVLEYTAIRRYD